MRNLKNYLRNIKTYTVNGISSGVRDGTTLTGL